jgi:hypothetical protein
VLGDPVARVKEHDPGAVLEHPQCHEGVRASGELDVGEVVGADLGREVDVVGGSGEGLGAMDGGLAYGQVEPVAELGQVVASEQA